MLDVLAAHGPDGVSLLNGEAVSFGHRLLKITQEDVFEAQPLTFGASPAQTGHQPILLVADARINNRVQLALDFNLAASETASLPDSAFVLKAWQRWGQDCVHHLIGAFAFAVWDPNLQQIFLARDHAGERPLYFSRTAHFFAFATTARAILACPGLCGEVDETTLARDMIGLPPEPFRTRFREVRSLAPGHCMVVSRDSDGAAPRRYWNFDTLPPTRFSSDRDYVDAFLEIFDEAVRCRLRTTGGIAGELSSGLDSGAVTATAARLLAGANKRLTAFTSVPGPAFSGVVPRDSIGNEGPFAAEVAALYSNIDHHLVDSTGSNMLREMARAFPRLDRPFTAPLNMVWINLILDRAAGAGVKVLLSGALGNFTISFAGDDIIRQSFRRGHWLKALRQTIQLRRNGVSSGRYAASIALFSALPWAIRTRVDPLVRSIGLKDTAIRPDRARELDLVDKIRRYLFLSETHLPPLMQTFFHANVLGDYNALANAEWGIESRHPAVDKRVFEYCASIPIEQYLVVTPGRSLIRRAMRGRLPDSTIDRRKRGLQAADWYESLTSIRAELACEFTLLEQSPGARRLLDLDRLRDALDHWPESARQAEQQRSLYQMALPIAISTGYFIRRCEGSVGQ